MPVPKTPAFTEVNPIDIDEMVLNNPAMQELYRNDKVAFEDKVSQLYHQSGYTREGIPRPLAQRAFAAIERETGIPEAVPQALTAMPAPAIGAVTGLVAGSVLGPAGGYAGAAIGSVGGEALNAELGITDPMTTGDVALAAGLPLAGPAVRRLKGAVKYLPGAGYGMHKAALEVAEEQAAKYGVTKATTKAAWDVVRAGEKYAMPIENTKAVLKERLTTLGDLSSITKGFGTESESKLVQGILDSAERTGVLDNRQATALFHYANEQKLKEGGEWWGRVAGSIMDDIERLGEDVTKGGYSVAAVEGAKALKKASAITKRLTATTELDALLSRVVTPLENDNAMKFNRDMFSKALQAVPKGGGPNAYVKGFGERDVQAMVEAVKSLGYITPSPAMSLSTVGRELLPVASLAAGAAKVVGAGSGWMPAMAIGLTLGQTTRMILGSETGRKWVAKLAKEQGGRVSQVQLQEMHAALLGGAAGSLQGLTSGDQDVPSSAYGILPHQVTIEKQGR